MMQLRCRVCAAVQAVSTADEADEDLRTQGIRRTFRLDHLESCGAGSVTLDLEPSAVPPVNPGLWDAYLAHADPPADVTPGADGFFTRRIVRDGVAHLVRVCEDCWQNIPRYVEFPAGLTSPESDDRKLRLTTVETDNPRRSAAAEHLPKAVCVPCYLAAFTRVYQDAAVPVVSETVVGDGAPVTIPSVTDDLGTVTLSRPSGKVAA